MARQAASGAVLGSPGVLATGDVAGAVLYYAASLAAPAFTYGSTTVGLATTTALTSALGNYLPLNGGTLSGDLHRSGAAGTNRQIIIETNGVARWAIGVDGSTESDDNDGSNLYVSRFATDGTWLGDPIGINRKTGAVEINTAIEVPDVEDFTTQEALSAKVVEGRYVRSVLAAGSTNIRVVDIQEDADGNLIATKSDGTTESYAATEINYSVDTNGYPVIIERVGPLLIQRFTAVVADGDAVSFPIVFSAIPNLAFGPQASGDSSANSLIANYVKNSLTVNGFKMDMRYLNSQGSG